MQHHQTRVLIVVQSLVQVHQKEVHLRKKAFLVHLVEVAHREVMEVKR